jgi:hypothetical protein
MLLASFLVGCSTTLPRSAYTPQINRNKIEDVLPTGWTLMSPTQDQRGFSSSFTHTETDAFTLLGPQPNYAGWIDKQGATHRDYIHKECIFLWLMPGDFKPKFRQTTIFNFFDPPWRPRLVFASPQVRVYGWVYQHTTDTNRAKQILKDATEIWCPEVRPSWASWHSDIAASLRR